MDFAKAFDKVSHRHLLYKLKFYGVDNLTLGWITDFLSDRTQTVTLDGEMSEKVPVTSGVPQGTVLGPILFLIYINDLPEYIQHSTLRLFADDSIIYREITSNHDSHLLQSDLEAAGRWEKDWQMHFHPDKCNILSITQKQQNTQHTYSLHGHQLEKVTSAKYLGITIQNNLKWNKHINGITSKANQSLAFLRRNLKINSRKARDHAYKAIVRPKLEYASTVWDPHCENQVRQLEKVQRRAARFVTNRNANQSSVTSMINDLKWPLLKTRRSNARLTMFYKTINKLVAIRPPPELLTLSDMRTRRAHSYKHIHTNKDSYKFSFFPRTIVQWSSLSPHICSAPTLENFRRQLCVASQSVDSDSSISP